MKVSHSGFSVVVLAALGSLGFWHKALSSWTYTVSMDSSVKEVGWPVSGPDMDRIVLREASAAVYSGNASETARPSPPRTREKVKPVKRKISKIYYVQTNPDRTKFMEQWLSQQSFAPYEKVVVPQVQESTGNALIDWREIYLKILDIHEESLLIESPKQMQQRNSTRIPSKRGLILVLQDDYRLFVPMFRRIEMSLRWLPGDFDVARIDCFQHGGELVNDEGLATIYATQMDEGADISGAWSHKATSSSSPVCPYHGGMHAMIWRGNRMNRLRNALSRLPGPLVTYEEMNCLLSREPLSDDDLRVYCLNYDQSQPVGCFHHLRFNPKPKRDDHNHINISDDAKGEVAFAAVREAEFLLSGETYRYRFAENASSPLDHHGPTLSRFFEIRSMTARLPLVVIGICSANRSVGRRQAIRQTWASRTAPAYFIVAGNWTPSLEKEFHLYRDIIWVDTTEDYKTGLTPKTMAFLHFAGQHNRNQRALSASGTAWIDYAFKTDDDMFVNVSQLEMDLSRPASHFNCTGQSQSGCRTGWFGGILQRGSATAENGPPIDYFGLALEHTRPVRDNRSKWYLSPEYYPEEEFPPYATGGGYALSSRFLDCAMKRMGRMRHIWWEDVATGLLAEACGARLSHANWDRDSILKPDQFFRSYSNERGFTAEQATKVDIAHWVSIESQFRLHQGLPVIIGEDPFKMARRCGAVHAQFEK